MQTGELRSRDTEGRWRMDLDTLQGRGGSEAGLEQWAVLSWEEFQEASSRVGTQRGTPIVWSNLTFRLR